LVRRLLEMETYRMMVLLAFPMARSIAPGIAEMDQQLAAINEQINAIRGLEDERRLLGQLSTLAARIEHLRSDTNFRFSAARAYYELVPAVWRSCANRKSRACRPSTSFCRAA
jgi:uncharacterized membrane-anchored protein